VKVRLIKITGKQNDAGVDLLNKTLKEEERAYLEYMTPVTS
jgi:hypothetical protein